MWQSDVMRSRFLAVMNADGITSVSKIFVYKVTPQDTSMVGLMALGMREWSLLVKSV